MSTAPTPLTRLLPDLAGRGLLLAAPADEGAIVAALEGQGFTIARADLSAPPAVLPEQPPGHPRRFGVVTRQAQATIAGALRLPRTAAYNLDAMSDCLRDMNSWWPDDPRVALLVEHAEILVGGDLPGWQVLSDILTDASEGFPGDRGRPDPDRALEIVALVDGHGVRALGMPPATAPEAAAPPPADPETW